MSARVSLQARVEQYLAERRKLGFARRSMGHGFPSFVSSTYWYRTGVPALMGLLGQRFERFANPWENGDE